MYSVLSRVTLRARLSPGAFHLAMFLSCSQVWLPSPPVPRLLSTPVGELRDWGLIVWCPCRSFPRHLPVERFAEEFGTRPTLERILGRLRCEKCHRAPGRVEAKRGDPFATRVKPVVLLESQRAIDRNRG